MEELELITALTTFAASTGLAWFAGQRSARHQLDQRIEEAVIALHQQQQVKLDELAEKMAQEDRDRMNKAIDQVDARFQIIKADFVMMAQDHIIELGRRQNPEIEETAKDDAEMVLKTKVGDFY